VSNSFPLVIESLVALLLLFTIGYCFLLNRRLKLFKADEMALKATISELMTATANAERAIAGLKATVRDCEQGLGERLRTAERVAAEMDRQLETGENILRRAPRGAETASNPKSVAAAAQAFAERARSRLNGLAA
jgi:methyl-accepting chemotaxis protein